MKDIALRVTASCLMLWSASDLPCDRRGTPRADKPSSVAQSTGTPVLDAQSPRLAPGEVLRESHNDLSRCGPESPDQPPRTGDTRPPAHQRSQTPALTRLRSRVLLPIALPHLCIGPANQVGRDGLRDTTRKTAGTLDVEVPRCGRRFAPMLRSHATSLVPNGEMATTSSATGGLPTPHPATKTGAPGPASETWMFAAPPDLKANQSPQPLLLPGSRPAA